jgi:hypothetical protein
LLPDELSLVGNKTGATRLGFAILLKAFQLESHFPKDKSDLPRALIGYVVKQRWLGKIMSKLNKPHGNLLPFYGQLGKSLLCLRL